MKILITGATGLIGRRLVTHLQDRKHEIVFLTTSEQKRASIEGADGFLWDPAKGSVDPESLSGVDTIIHLAGASIGERWTESYKKEIIRSRVASADALYRAVSGKHQVKQFVSASGIGIYPDSTSQHYDENFNGTSPGFVAGVVRQWEKSADAFELLGIKVAKVRTGLVLSTSGGALPKLAGTIRLGVGSPLGSGKQIVSWIHIEDLIGIYTLVVEKQLQGIYNAVAPAPVSQAELTRQMARTMDKPQWLPNVPGFLLKLLLGEMATLLTEGQFVENSKILQEGYKFRFPEIGSALEDLLGK